MTYRLRSSVIARHGLLVLAWLALWRISALMEYSPHASLWFPPAGLTLAALLVMGWRALPALMFCAIATAYWGSTMYAQPIPWHQWALAGALFGVVHCASYGIGAGGLRRMARRSGTQSLPTMIMAFLVIGSLAALCAALSGVQSLQWSGLLTPRHAVGLWLPWWIGDMAGALVLTPMFLALLSRSHPQIRSWFGGLDFQMQDRVVGPYLGKLLLSVCLLSLVMLATARFQRAEIAYTVFFLIIPQMWIVYTESPFLSTVSLAVFSTCMAIWTAVLGLVDQALVFQFAICVIAASSYFGLAVPVLIASNRQLSALAFSDGLTKVASKQHFFDRCEQEMARSRRYEFPVSLILLDIDRFKDINDSYGHAVGDEALVQLTMTVKMELRQSDVIGRFGGDEFMLLLPGSGLDKAVATAERLRRSLLSQVVPGTDRVIEASFGVVRIQPDETIMQAFKRADELLLDIKHSGRNSIGQDAGPA